MEHNCEFDVCIRQCVVSDPRLFLLDPHIVMYCTCGCSPAKRLDQCTVLNNHCILNAVHEYITILFFIPK